MNEHSDYVDPVPLVLAFVIFLAFTPIGIVVGDIPRTFLIGGVLSAPLIGAVWSVRYIRRFRRERDSRPLTASRGRG